MIHKKGLDFEAFFMLIISMNSDKRISLLYWRISHGMPVCYQKICQARNYKGCACK